MADYIVKDTELTSVANAIRTAGGTNSLLSFPNGFISAVGNIGGGGGGSSDFSTAQVTLNLTAVDGEQNPVSIVSETVETGFEFHGGQYATSALQALQASEHKVDVVMYQNSCFLCAVTAFDELDNVYSSISGTPTTTGGVVWNAENEFFEVSGDGTITAVLEMII